MSDSFSFHVIQLLLSREAKLEAAPMTYARIPTEHSGNCANRLFCERNALARSNLSDKKSQNSQEKNAFTVVRRRLRGKRIQLQQIDVERLRDSVWVGGG